MHEMLCILIGNIFDVVGCSNCVPFMLQATSLITLLCRKSHCHYQGSHQKCNALSVHRFCKGQSQINGFQRGTEDSFFPAKNCTCVTVEGPHCCCRLWKGGLVPYFATQFTCIAGGGACQVVCFPPTPICCSTPMCRLFAKGCFLSKHLHWNTLLRAARGLPQLPPLPQLPFGASNSTPAEPSKEHQHVDFRRLTAFMLSAAESKECSPQLRRNEREGIFLKKKPAYVCSK